MNLKHVPCKLKQNVQTVQNQSNMFQTLAQAQTLAHAQVDQLPLAQAQVAQLPK